MHEDRDEDAKERAAAYWAAMPQETISFYLDLEPGTKADFEVVGRSAAAFAETVKEIAYLLEPGLEIKLEFDSSKPGSLKLNAILKGLKARDRSVLITIAVAV